MPRFGPDGRLTDATDGARVVLVLVSEPRVDGATAEIVAEYVIAARHARGFRCDFRRAVDGWRLDACGVTWLS